VAKIRGNNTVFVENAVSISSEISNFFLRAVEDLAGNDLKPNRVNNETQFTILMPGIEFDFGDAPDPVSTTPGRYPTLQSADGARHVYDATGLRLGSGISPELDGTPTPRADGDANDDGVSFQFQSLIKPVFNRNVDTTITVTLNEPGIVDGWIDFNGDGDWTDPGENVIIAAEFTNASLTRQFQVRVPATAPIPAAGINSFARFRASTTGQALPTGLALDGEVEDYLVRIIPGIPPVGVSDIYTMDEDQLGGLVTTDPYGLDSPGFTSNDGVLANDLSPDGRVRFAKLITPPSQVALGGSFVFQTNGTFSYSPSPDFNGIDTFVYVSFVNIDVNEGELIESLASTTVTIDVRQVNDVPTAENFDSSTDEDVPLTLTEQSVIILSRATRGPANEAGQTLRVSLPNSVSAQGGSLNLSGGNIVYTPRTDFSGTDTFEFTLTDNGITRGFVNPLSVTRTVTITVRDVNDAPILAPKTFPNAITEDVVDSRNSVPVSFFITSADLAGPPAETDPIPVGQGQTLSFTSVERATEKFGTVSFANGLVTYTPARDFNGVDRFYYIVTDSHPTDPKTARGTVTVTVTAVNDAPRVVASLGTITMDEDAAERALPLASYFFDPDVIPNDDRLTYRIVSNTNPTLVVPTIGPNDIFVRPNPNQNGLAVIVFEARDSGSPSLTVTNTLTVIVGAVNDAPVLAAPLPNLSVNEDAIIPDTTLSPTYFFDPDVLTNGDVLTFTVTNSNSDVVTASIVNGRLTLTLVPDASGLATITVRAVDNAGNIVEDSFDLSVAAVNDAPRVVNDSFYTTPQGSELRTTDPRGTLTTLRNDDGVLANDSDPEGNSFTARLRTAPTRGTVALNADGTFTYTPNTSTLQGALDTFTYDAVDSIGATSGLATVTITITRPLPSRHQNPSQKLDVNADGFISPIDVLLIVNFLNSNSSAGGSVPVAGLPAPPPFRDVNGNGFIEPLDVLEVINEINRRGNSGSGSGSGEGEGEGEMVGLWSDNSNSAVQLSWTSDVMRSAPSTSVSMVSAATWSKPSFTNQLLGNGVKPAPSTLSDYLSSFGTDDEEVEKLALMTSDSLASDDHESLDSFFAEVFGS